VASRGSLIRLGLWRPGLVVSPPPPEEPPPPPPGGTPGLLVPGAATIGTWAAWDAVSQPLAFEPNGTVSDLGYGRVACARHYTVPFQPVFAPFTIENQAFHIGGDADNPTGIQYMAGAAADGELAIVEARTLSADGRSLFEWDIDPADWEADGLTEFRFFPVPDVGLPCILQGLGVELNEDYTSLQLYMVPSGATYRDVWVSGSGSDTTGNGTDPNPYRTPGRAKEHLHATYGTQTLGRILALPGSYDFSTTTGSGRSGLTWLEFKPAPGVDREDVIVTGSDSAGMRINRLKIDGCRMTGAIFNSSGSNGRLWLHNVHAVGTSGVGTTWGRGVWRTGDESVYEGAGCDRAPVLTRGVTVRDTSADAFSHTRCLVSAVAEGLFDSGGSHCDVIAFNSSSITNGLGYFNNHIADGLTAVDSIATQGSLDGNCPRKNGAWNEVDLDNTAAPSESTVVLSVESLVENFLFRKVNAEGRVAVSIAAGKVGEFEDVVVAQSPDLAEFGEEPGVTIRAV